MHSFVRNTNMCNDKKNHNVAIIKLKVNIVITITLKIYGTTPIQYIIIHNITKHKDNTILAMLNPKYPSV
ncbi:putative orfan [Tupanvirus soda lake]|uniref:Orfan n=2 Tax=Tupanvirus TaxID=2094720 RepID=A0AC62AB48_9VIRU|nr:putative orfan [Tupanvirus soda lake]QKU35000.1 putative orfan [Tupanvirus soda lake]